MTVPFWCLFIIVLMPILVANLTAYFRIKQESTYNYHEPREQAARLTGAGARAVAAQQNCWEALAMFTPAVLVSHLMGVEAGLAANLCMAFVALRIAYVAFYIKGWANARALSFIAGLIICIALFVLSA